MGLMASYKWKNMEALCKCYRHNISITEGYPLTLRNWVYPPTLGRKVRFLYTHEKSHPCLAGWDGMLSAQGRKMNC